MNVYVLTPLTRSVNLQRRVVIQGFDLPVRGLTITGLALLPALPVAGILWQFIGSYALVSVLVIEAAAHWLIESRTRNGLRLRRYQRFIDIRKSVNGTFLVCSHPVKPLHDTWGYVVASAMPGRIRTRPELVLEAANTTDLRTRRMVRGETKLSKLLRKGATK
jgi:hypothetical protein